LAAGAACAGAVNAAAAHAAAARIANCDFDIPNTSESID
jgi:hypothetical protein